MGWQALLYLELSSFTSKAKALLFVCFICLSLNLENQVNFPSLESKQKEMLLKKRLNMMLVFTDNDVYALLEEWDCYEITPCLLFLPSLQCLETSEYVYTQII